MTLYLLNHFLVHFLLKQLDPFPHFFHFDLVLNLFLLDKFVLVRRVVTEVTDLDKRYQRLSPLFTINSLLLYDFIYLLRLSSGLNQLL